MAESRVKIVMRWVLAVFFVGAGANHFISPAVYRAMVPGVLPAPDVLIAVSGVAEIAGGLGLMIPATRRLSAWGLIALLLAVFPANINMAVNQLPLGSHALPAWALWGRLPLQFVLIAWAYWFTGRTRRDPAAVSSKETAS